MKKNMKIFKKTIKMFSILFLTVISSLFFVNKTKAFTSDDGYNYVQFKYNYEKVNEIKSKENFNKAIDYIMNDFNNSDYNVYTIYFTNDNSVHAVFGYDYLIFLASKKNDNTNVYLEIDFETRAKYKHIYYDFTTDKGSTVYESLNQPNVARYSQLFNVYNDKIETFNINSEYPYFAIYDSNIDIYTYSWSDKFYLFYDLNKNSLIPHGSKMPLVKNSSYITFDIKNNYASGTENIISKDLTIKYNVDDYTKYIYLYKKENDNTWSTYNFTSSNTSLTLNVTSNISYIARILDKSTNEILFTSTFNITNINDFDNLKLVKTFNSGTNGNDLYSLNITNTSNHDIPFKIQFGSNDFSSKYVPRVSGIKGYIYVPGTQQKKDSNLVSIKDFKCYKEIEGDTEVWCTGVLSKPQGTSAYYQIIFENTDNYYLYYYDSFSNNERSLDITTNLFKDYNKYRFNSNSNKAYIYLKNKGQTNMKGSVIIPYYYLNNDDLSVKLLKYNRINNTYGDEYSSYFIGDNYYKEIPFTVDDNTVPVLTNKKNQHCETYYYGEGTANADEGGYYTWIGDTKTFVPFSYNNSIWMGNHYIFKGLTCYQEEPVYFYVHKDFKVSFNIIDEDKNSTSDVVISDDNGNIFFDIDKDSDNTNVYKEENKSFFDMVKESFNYFTSPLSEFLNMFTHFWNGLNIIIKYFIVFIFVFILALFILRFIL